MAKDVANKMTLEQALTILKGDLNTYSYLKVQEALELVKQQDPNNPVLKDFIARSSAFEKDNSLQSDDAEMYAQNGKSIDDQLADYSFDKFLKAKNNQDIAKYVDRTEVLDSVNNNVLGEQEKKSYLNLLFEGAKLKAQTSLSGSDDFAKMPKSAQIKALKDEVKTIFFADFAQTSIASQLPSSSKEEQKIGSEAYKQYIRKQVDKATSVFNEVINGSKKIKVTTDAILSSCADTAVKVENYIKALRYKAQKMLATTARETTQKANSLVDAASDKFTALANSLQSKKNKFEKLANTVSKNRYEIWKNIKGSFHDNKLKLIGNVIANSAFGYWTAMAASGAAATGAAPVLVPAVIAYGAYHAAGSWVYPVIAEMRKINRKRKEAGEEKLSFTQALKQAWKNKMSSRKDKRNYIVGGVVNTALATVGCAWLKDGLEAADNVATLTEGAKEGLNVTLAANIAETKHAISLGRAGTGTVAQLVDASIAYGVACKDPDNKEKANEFKQAGITALVGLGLNTVFQAAGFAQGQHHGADINDVNSSAGDIASEKAHDAASAIKETTPNTNAADGKGWKGWFSKLFFRNEENNSGDYVTKSVDAPVESPANAADSGLFPKTYSTDMGISKGEYNVLVSTTEGTLKAATGEEVTLDRAYMNLDGMMDQFPGKTKEEVIYKFNRLYAFMRKAYEVGDGTLRETPSGVDYLENRFEALNLKLDDDKMNTLVSFAQRNTYADKSAINEGLAKLFPDGLSAKDQSSIVTIIHSNQRFYQNQKEMEALINLLGCGEKISAQEAVAVNKLLDNTDALLATGKANTQLTGLSLAKDCHDDDGEWMRIEQPQPIQPKITPAPQIPDEPPVAEPEPIEIDKVDPIDKPIVMPVKLSIPEEDIHVPVEPTPVPAEPTPEPVPDVKKVRKVIITGMSQLEGENAPDKEKILSDERAARMLKRFGQNSKE